MGINWNRMNSSAFRASRRSVDLHDDGTVKREFSEYRVTHPKFGDGTVVWARDSVLTVVFDSGETRRMHSGSVIPRG